MARAVGSTLAVLLLVACASGGGARTGAQAAGGDASPQDCDGARASVEKTLWPTGGDAARLTRAEVPGYVVAAKRMLAACSTLAAAAHQRERDLELVAAGDALGKELAALPAMGDSELALALPAHAASVRRYLYLTDALRGRSR